MARSPSCRRGGEARFHAVGGRDPVGRAGPRSRPATFSPVSRWKAPRPRTSPVVCRALRNCSRPAVRRITPSSPRSTARPLRPRLQEQAPHPIEPEEEGAEPVEYLIPKGKHLPSVQEGDYIEKGEYILDGNPAPHDILAIKGVEALRPTSSTRSRRSTGCRA
jgi:hypothetical protein